LHSPTASPFTGAAPPLAEKRFRERPRLRYRVVIRSNDNPEVT
jgi:hypothetical protein